MKVISKIFTPLLRQEDGATAIEYGLIAALVSLAIAISVFAFGDTLNTLFFEDLVGMLSN